eukprot:GHRR01036351.1.p1 GENE.GHRR01036351.1~~GHRR01036351.1.p1  ORF type:complete len:102 (-),score=12.06 GHRR01036351.1:208-513(-)
MHSTCRIPTLNNIETSNAVWVFAKWGVKPSDAWLSAFLSHLPSQLLTMQPPEICSVLWAAAMMPLHLPSQVLDGLLLESQVSVFVIVCQTQQVSAGMQCQA